MCRRILPSARVPSIRRSAASGTRLAAITFWTCHPAHSRVLPAARLKIAGAGMASRATDGWTEARHAGRGLVPRAGRGLAPRAGRALAASFALAAIGMPAALLTSQAPAAAATGRRLASSQVSLAITSMTPQVARPGATITVTGTVTNTSRQQVSKLSVQLLASSTPVSNSAELQPGSTEQAELASSELPEGIWNSTGALQPGSKDNWSVRVTAKSIGMTRFGVYPLTAEAQTTLGQVAAATTFLPYVPAKKGPDGSSIPARAKISWVLPLIDRPLLDQPWQANCKGAQAQALATSLGSQGRLGELVAAGAGSMGTADAYSAATGSRQAAQNRAVSSESAQSISGFDGVTWAVDPALLANVKALADCGAAQPSWARAAQNWLTQLRQVTSAEPVFVTPYADPDVAALNKGKSQDLQTSFDLGNQIGQRVLHRNLGSFIAWPADGIAGYSTVEYLAAKENVRTLLLSTAALRNAPSTVVRVANGDGSYMNILLANASITNLMATRNRSTGSTFSIAQDFLAQTALAAQQDPGSPIIVAPPRRWDPPAGLAADLLTDTASAPWLSPVSLTSLTAGPRIPVVHESHLVQSPTGMSKQELGKITRLDNKANQLKALAAKPDNNLSVAVATVESSAWQGRSTRTALRMLAFVKGEISRQEHDVQIFASPRWTLGGLRGTVPVSIDNRLGYAVKVKLDLQSQSPGVKITTFPGGVLTIPKHNALTVKLHVQATQVGATTVTMSLENENSQPLEPTEGPVRMTVEATQVGVLGVIICAAALGVFLIAYTARAIRRGRPDGGADHPVDHGLAADQGSDQSAEPAEPDTVMAERTQSGTAGAPGT
jgi:hypothetical protein